MKQMLLIIALCLGTCRMTMAFNRWYMPGELGQETMTYDLPLSKTPSFAGRYVIGQEMGAWNGYGGLYTPGGQVWCYLVPPEKHFAEHPEYYALVNGERIPGSPHEGQLCTTNPEVVRLFAEAVMRVMEEEPDTIIAVSPNDNDDFCECAECQALGKRLGGNMTDRLVFFLNQVAALTRERYPQRKMTFLAYSIYTEPPIKVRPDPLLVPQIARIGRYFYGISEEHLSRLIAGWCALSETISTYEYVGHWSWYGLLPTWREFARDLRIYRRLGVDIVCSETHPHWATQGLNLWMAQVLAWDCDLGVDDLIDDYCTGMFHAAAPAMIAFYNVLEDDTWRLHVGSPGKFFSVDLLTELRCHMRQALALAQGDETAMQRLRLVEAGLRFTQHWAAGFRWKDKWLLGGNDSCLRFAATEWRLANDVVQETGEKGFQTDLVLGQLQHLIEQANKHSQ
jgi:hypothetical protein